MCREGAATHEGRDTDRLRARIQAVGWAYVLGRLLPAEFDTALAQPGRHVPCPVHGGVDGFRFFAKGRALDPDGGGICNSCGAFADGFRILGWVHRWTFAEAAKRIEELLGVETAEPPRPALPHRVPRGRSGPDPERLRQRCRELWASALPLSADAAEPGRVYLRSRGYHGCDLKGLRDVRLHPCLAHFAGRARRPTGRFPALLCVFRNPEGLAINLHQTWLRPDGSGKADLPSNKQFRRVGEPRALSGGALRLFPLVGDSLAVTEGVETAFAVRAATGLPVWATGNASLLRSFAVPRDVRRLLIFADHDPERSGPRNEKVRPGAIAAQALAAAAEQPGRVVEVLLPTPTDPARGRDWDDVWREEGRAGFDPVPSL